MSTERIGGTIDIEDKRLSYAKHQCLYKYTLNVAPVDVCVKERGREERERERERDRERERERVSEQFLFRILVIISLLIY